MNPSIKSAGGSGLAFMLRALRYKNYRLFFIGQIISLIGTWMTNVATSWLVYRLTGSAWLLGVVGFASQFPAFLVAPFAGIYVDRWNQHRLLMITQILSMLQSFALAALTMTGKIDIPLIFVLSITQGIINAFDMPCRQAFLVRMIEHKEDLGNAIALNSSVVNAARLVGPSIGGIIIAAAGEGWCFLIDGVSFLAVIGALGAMTISAAHYRTHKQAGALEELREGWNYTVGSLPIRHIIQLLALVSLVGFPYTVLAPVFAGKVLHGGPHTLGFLMAASGFGALTGAMWLAARKSVLGLTRAIPMATAIFGAGLIAFALSRMIWLSLLLMVATGFGFMMQLASSNTILQTIVHDDKRGRVMSFFMMAFLGTAPFGSLLAGSLADRIGAPRTIFLGGACCIAGALWFARGLPALRKAINPIYAQMGILPQLAKGVEDAVELAAPPED